MSKVSIVIPTYGAHLNDYLKPCLNSIVEYTDLSQVEVIVVANGCTDRTEEYLKTLPEPGFKSIISKEPLGYTGATNRGIEKATGEYILLLNNDVVILPQVKNRWMELLLSPFIDPTVGATGPLKFTWHCNGIPCTTIAFWCAMIRREMFTKLGLLDEIFNPGMGEDGDFCRKMELAGYRMVQVPVDQSHEFGKSATVDRSFPIYHKGSGTFGEGDYSKITARNHAILVERYGKKGMDGLEQSYSWCLNHASSTNKLFPTLRKYAEKCSHVTEFGVLDVFSTWAFLAARPKRMVSYDTYVSPNMGKVKASINETSVSYDFKNEDVLKATIEPTDLLFLDTKHTYAQVKAELDRHAGSVKKFILIHDTETYGEKGEDGGPGEGQAIREFLRDHPEWDVVEHLSISHGLTVLGRKHIVEKYSLPDGYQHRTSALPYVAATPDPIFQKEVYDKAASLFTSGKYRTVIDVGCGCGTKTVSHFLPDQVIGVEVEPNLSRLKAVHPGYRWEPVGFVADADLVICADVLEHVDDPDTLLDYIKKLNPKVIVFSTPDREQGNAPMGPPENPCHVREWTQAEFVKYLSGHFDVQEHFISNKAHGTHCVVCRPKSGILHSIVIPTCGHKPGEAIYRCWGALHAATSTAGKEVIVVANGCPQHVLDEIARWPVQLLKYPDRIGYVRAVNAGIDAARGEFITLLDDDSILQPQQMDGWLTILHKPFSDPKVAAAGPFMQTYDDLGQVLHSGCTMYRASALREVGRFDEIFNPGYMSDEDLSIRIRKAGYKLAEVPDSQKKVYAEGAFRIQFPVVHMGTVQTMDKAGNDLPLVVKNRKILYERHGDAPKELVQTPATPVKRTISIIIPTYGKKLNDLLKPAIASIVKYTDMTDVEIVVVANGCTDGTEDWVRSLGPGYTLVTFPDALGYTRATNEGIKVAKGNYLIFFNNDNEMLPQPKNQWINFLIEPFERDPKVGITGPLQLHDNYADEDVIIGFCLCISRKVMDAAGGLLDEIYSPGGGEDIDLCCKVRRMGYKVIQVPKQGKLGYSHTNTGDFMIWHKNNQTFKDIPEYTHWYVKRNGLINVKRYNKNIKLNLGAGGIEYPGYLSVDLYDNRATIIMDATKLDFDDNSVSEILALHLFEHINPYKAMDVLREWKRVLKPGGKLIMEMPDIEQLCKRFVTANTGQRYGILNAVYGSVNTTSEGNPSDITAPHLFGWWPQSIGDHLINAGFRNIVIGPEQHPHPESNMRVEAIKP